MRVAVTVVTMAFFWMLCSATFERDFDFTIFFRRGRECGDFQRVQRFARVAVGNFCEMAQRIFIGGNFSCSRVRALRLSTRVATAKIIPSSPNGRSSKICERETSGELTKKNGLCVVAPINLTTPLSTSGSKTSCALC